MLDCSWSLIFGVHSEHAVCSWLLQRWLFFLASRGFSWASPGLDHLGQPHLNTRLPNTTQSSCTLPGPKVSPFPKKGRVAPGRWQLGSSQTPAPKAGEQRVLLGGETQKPQRLCVQRCFLVFSHSLFPFKGRDGIGKAPSVSPVMPRSRPPSTAPTPSFRTWITLTY